MIKKGWILIKIYKTSECGDDIISIKEYATWEIGDQNNIKCRNYQSYAGVSWLFGLMEIIGCRFFESI